MYYHRHIEETGVSFFFLLPKLSDIRNSSYKASDIRITNLRYLLLSLIISLILLVNSHGLLNMLSGLLNSGRMAAVSFSI